MKAFLAYRHQFNKSIAKVLLAALFLPLLPVPSAQGANGFMESARTNMTYSWRARAAGQVVREIKSEYTLCQDGTEGCAYQTEWVEETTWHRDNIFSGSKLIQTLGEGDMPFNDRVIYQTDHLGSPRLSIGKQTDENGVEYEAVLARHTYQPFGEEITESEDKQPLKFTGHERDSDDLDYMRGRYYKPSTGRFLQPDPSRADGWSLYSYAHNNPVGRVDVDGLNDQDAARGGNGNVFLWMMDGIADNAGAVIGAIDAGLNWLLNDSPEIVQVNAQFFGQVAAESAPGVGEAITASEVTSAQAEGQYLKAQLITAVSVAGYIPGVGDAISVSGRKAIHAVDDVFGSLKKSRSLDGDFRSWGGDLFDKSTDNALGLAPDGSIPYDVAKRETSTNGGVVISFDSRSTKDGVGEAVLNLRSELSGKITVLSGTHGGPSGRITHPERLFLEQDIENLGHIPDVEIVDMGDPWTVLSDYTNPSKGDACVAAFCFSYRNNVVKTSTGR